MCVAVLLIWRTTDRHGAFRALDGMNLPELPSLAFALLVLLFDAPKKVASPARSTLDRLARSVREQVVLLVGFGEVDAEPT